MFADSVDHSDPNTFPVVRQPTGRLMPSVPAIDLAKNAKLASASDSPESLKELKKPTANANSAKDPELLEATVTAPYSLEVNQAKGNEAEVFDLVEPAEPVESADRESGRSRRSSRRSRRGSDSRSGSRSDSRSGSRSDSRSDSSSADRTSRAVRAKGYRQPSWDEIDVDGLPFRDMDESAAEEVENDATGTRFRDICGLFIALAVSLFLSQVGLWWFVGIDPFGLGPLVSGWAPSIVPGDFSK